MLYWIILIILLLLSALLLVKIKVTLQYKLEGTDDYTLMIFSLFWDLIKIRYRLPRRPKKELKEEEKSRNWFENIHDKYENAKELVSLLFRAKVLLKDKAVLKDFNVFIEVGTGDACYTGIASGFIWAAAGILTSYIANTFKTEKECVDVKSNFQGKKFVAQLYCIFSIRIVHIITVGFKLLLHKIKNGIKNKFKKGGGTIGAASN